MKDFDGMNFEFVTNKMTKKHIPQRAPNAKISLFFQFLYCATSSYYFTKQ